MAVDEKFSKEELKTRRGIQQIFFERLKDEIY